MPVGFDSITHTDRETELRETRGHARMGSSAAADAAAKNFFCVSKENKNRGEIVSLSLERERPSTATGDERVQGDTRRRRRIDFKSRVCEV
jgi:hypothetical protein